MKKFIEKVRDDDEGRNMFQEERKKGKEEEEEKKTEKGPTAQRRVHDPLKTVDMLP